MAEQEYIIIHKILVEIFFEMLYNILCAVEEISSFFAHYNVQYLIFTVVMLKLNMI